MRRQRGPGSDFPGARVRQELVLESSAKCEGRVVSVGTVRVDTDEVDGFAKKVWHVGDKMAALRMDSVLLQ